MNPTIAIIGQGYVGLPLALEFAKHYPVIGFDINAERVDELNQGKDHTLEADLDLLNKVIAMHKAEPSEKGYQASADLAVLAKSNIYIVTVPTPIDQFSAPDLRPLLGASKMLGKVLKKDDIVIYESTVYPGCTEEDCVPVLEAESGLRLNEDFYVGYSPERIVPGDKINTLTSIKKVTSGSTPEIAKQIDDLYQQIITAGTHLAPNIKTAETNKTIENAQRDVNISFVNELALIFDKVGVDTHDVLDAAGTKFNFLKYKPGLVGGHCISVDPYYLSHKAIQLGYHPQVILSGRRVNDMMATFIGSKVIKLMIQKGHQIKGSRVLIMGVTFKENCPDIRNTKVVEVYKELQQYGVEVDLYDPWANPEEVQQEYNIDCHNELPCHSELVEESAGGQNYEAVILAVAHKQFLNMDIKSLLTENAVVFDAKAVLPRELVDARL